MGLRPGVAKRHASGRLQTERRVLHASRECDASEEKRTHARSERRPKQKRESPGFFLPNGAICNKKRGGKWPSSPGRRNVPRTKRRGSTRALRAREYGLSRSRACRGVRLSQVSLARSSAHRAALFPTGLNLSNTSCSAGGAPRPAARRPHASPIPREQPHRARRALANQHGAPLASDGKVRAARGRGSWAAGPSPSVPCRHAPPTRPPLLAGAAGAVVQT